MTLMVNCTTIGSRGVQVISLRKLGVHCQMVVARGFKGSCGLVGLPNVGKSSLFNAFVKKEQARVDNFPFCTIDPNIASVTVDDPILERLAITGKSKQIVSSSLEFRDIAGLIKGAHTGDGLGNKFLENIRQCDVILHVVRCFSDSSVTHVSSIVDPILDIKTIFTELLLSDLQLIDKRLDKICSIRQKHGDSLVVLKVLEHCREVLNIGMSASTIDFSSLIESDDLVDAISYYKSLRLLSAKPILYICNVSDSSSETERSMVNDVSKYVKNSGELGGFSDVASVHGKLESEVACLPLEEQNEYFQSFGIEKSVLPSVISVARNLCDQICFYTVGEMEARSWDIRRGSSAVMAASVIHTDIAKNFIKAEIVRPNVFNETGSFEAARRVGRAHLRSRDHVIDDRDIIIFHHNG